MPARYAGVNALRAVGLFPGSLFVAAVGAPGRVPKSRRDYGCSAASGGLFVVRPDGRGSGAISAALIAGLPFAQDARNRTPRAYDVRDVAGDASNPHVLYTTAAAPGGIAAHGSPPPGLYRSTDDGAHWQPIMRGLPGPGARAHAPLVLPVVDPAHGAIIFEIVRGSLYRSPDRGTHWMAPRGLRGGRQLRLFINPANPNLAYALTDTGLYHSRDAGATWTRLTDRRLPPVGDIRMLGFDPHATSDVVVTPSHGRPLRLVERRPLRARFDLALTLTPLRYDQVTLALHAAPRARARLVVVRGAHGTSARLSTDNAGFGYAVMRLDGRVTPAALRIRVELGGRRVVVAPWLPPGWIPGLAPRPAPRATATPTVTPSPTATFTPSPTPTPSVPTPYPTSTLNTVWAWKPISPTLPLCAPPVATPTAMATATATASVTTTGATATMTPPPPTAPGTPVAVTPTVTAPTPTITPSPTATPCSAAPPLPRQDAAAGWDNVDHRLYIFGGTDSKTAASYNDIAAYSTITNAWIPITPQGGPPPGRRGASAAWDPVANRLLIFGGMTGAGPYAHFTNDVWAYTPATNAWTQLWPNIAAGGPSPRAHAAATWDATNNRMIIFGGQFNDGTTPSLANDMWAFTPSGNGSWAQLSPPSGDQSLPPPRQAAQIAWDTTAGVVRLFGGKNPGSGAMSDTWTWSPSAGWTFENVPDQPPGRQGAGYAWDDTHARFVVGPGVSLLGDSDDLWVYETPAHDWEPIPVAAAPLPPPRQFADMVWDSADDQALLFGGRLAGAGTANDLWALTPTGAAAPAATPQAPASVGKGIDLGQTVSPSSDKVLLTAAQAQAVADAGAAYARVSFYIGDGNTQWTASRLHAYEQVIAMLSQRGVGVLAVASSGITGGWIAANWTQNAQETTGGNGDNPAIDNYVQQLTVLVNHFHDAPFNVRRWEVWNEPNVPLALCSQTDLSCLQQPSLQPSNFAALLAIAYKAIKTGPTVDVQLVSGGIFGHSIGGAYSNGASGSSYIARTYDAGINRTGLWGPIKGAYGTYPLDAVGQHLYVDQGQRTTPADIRAYLDWFRAGYVPYEGTAKGTEITEVGWRTGDVNQPQVRPDLQALNLATLFATARRAGYVRDIAWFQLQDNPAYRYNTSWGLLDRYGHPKPAYDTFKQQ